MRVVSHCSVPGGVCVCLLRGVVGGDGGASPALVVGSTTLCWLLQQHKKKKKTVWRLVSGDESVVTACDNGPGGWPTPAAACWSTQRGQRVHVCESGLDRLAPPPHSLAGLREGAYMPAVMLGPASLSAGGGLVRWLQTTWWWGVSQQQ